MIFFNKNEQEKTAADFFYSFYLILIIQMSEVSKIFKKYPISKFQLFYKGTTNKDMTCPVDLNSVYKEFRCQLKEIVRSLLQEKQQYQKEINRVIQKMVKDFDERLKQKENIIVQLESRIVQILQSTKQINQNSDIKLKDQEEEIRMLKLLLRKKHVNQLALENKLKKIRQKEKKKNNITARKSQEKYLHYLSPKKPDASIKKRTSCQYNKYQTEKDQQPTLYTSVGKKRHAFLFVASMKNLPTSVIKSSRNIKDDKFSKIKLSKSSVITPY